jgi:hypothetical protein
MKKTLEPAFPRTYGADGHNGMDLRDYFAAQVLGDISDRLVANLMLEQDPTAVQRTAMLAYAIADAMMAERDGITNVSQKS